MCVFLSRQQMLVAMATGLFGSVRCLVSSQSTHDRIGARAPGRAEASPKTTTVTYSLGSCTTYQYDACSRLTGITVDTPPFSTGCVYDGPTSRLMDALDGSEGASSLRADGD
jgi:hypothetical protein